VHNVDAIGQRLRVWVERAGRLRWGVLGLVVAASIVLVAKHGDLWSRELAALSPVPAADQALDMAMRADLGAPDVRYLVVVTGADQDLVLANSERVAATLKRLEAAGVIDGFESPSTYLPSQATQSQRQASLPPDDVLRRRFKEAIAGLPVHLDRFEPFFADVAKARSQTTLSPSDIQGTSLAEGVDSLLVRSEGRWTALLPLRDASTRGPNEERVRAALAQTGLGGVHFVDLKGESNRLYEGYLREAILLSLAGVAAILGLLFFVTRSPVRVFHIAAPLIAAVVVVIAGLVLAGHQLTILHLVGMLLVVAVGSNYALFFDRGAAGAGISARTLASLLLAVSTTAVGFGILAFSSVPVLSAIGSTVGPGAVLALVFSAILARRTSRP
jgi:predicted exporter